MVGKVEIINKWRISVRKSDSKTRKVVLDRMVKIGTSLRSSQVEELEKYFPAAQQLQSKAIQGGIDLFIQGMHDYGEKFVLSYMLGEKNKYKVVPCEEVSDKKK